MSEGDLPEQGIEPMTIRAVHIDAHPVEQVGEAGSNLVRREEFQKASKYIVRIGGIGKKLRLVTQ